MSALETNLQVIAGGFLAMQLYLPTQALEIFRASPDGGTEVVSAAEKLAPIQLYRLDHADPPFMRAATRRP